MDEFDFIRNIKKNHSLRLIGDDCAVLPKDDETDLIVTSDMLVENVDFRIDWTDPYSLGHKALAVSLSDIAAMGSRPNWALLSLGVPERLWRSEFLGRFYEGWHALAGEHGVELAGGDISRIDGPLVIDSIVGGDVPKGKAVLRSGASPGDSVYVSGPLGSSAAGLILLQEGRGDTRTFSNLVRKHILPEPRLDLARRLRESGAATAMIDLSDGISSDLAHLCRASGTGATIAVEGMPFDAGLMEFAGSLDAAIELALHGGEDYELLYTGDPATIAEAGLDNAFRIGVITDTPGVIEIVRNGEAVELPARGYRHFV